MFGREQRVLLRHYLEKGLTKTAIAEKLGVSRRTVYHWIETGQLDRDLDAEPVRYAPRRAVAWKLDPYKPIIDERLGQYPELSATRLFEEGRAAGYTGGYTQVKVYVRQVRPRPPEEPVVRFETPPGRQAQVDFADFRFPWGKRYALLVVLGYSRLLWVRFFPRKNTAALYEGLEAAFRFFGGVPRELLFDQLKNVILEDRRMDGGELLKNEEFLRFAAHWGFQVRACRPYRAQTKGKVERPVSYLRGNFVYGPEFVGDADLEARLQQWLDRTANVRIHGTTKVRPVLRFQKEKSLLLPMAERSYRSLVLPRERKVEPSSTGRITLPRVPVERRPLATYARIAGGAR
jgi:transposase